MQPFTYLLVDLLTVIICFIFSFDKRIQFNKHFPAFLKAAIIVAIPFILWDVWFTKMGVWWFDLHYTLGFSLAGLPIEEWLFFICIPFSSVFTYFCLDKFFNLDWTNIFSKYIVWLTVAVCVTLAIIFHNRMYPFVTALITAISVLYLYYVAKVNWLGKASLVFLVLMLGFLPVNGVLTGTGIAAPIVNYNPKEILHVRLFTIPIEDVAYGYAQFILVVYFFKIFKKKNHEK